MNEPHDPGLSVAPITATDLGLRKTSKSDLVSMTLPVHVPKKLFGTVPWGKAPSSLAAAKGLHCQGIIERNVGDGFSQVYGDASQWSSFWPF